MASEAIRSCGWRLKNKLGRFAFANVDILRGRILKAALGDLYNVVLELEVRQTQLAGLSELLLKLSVEKDACVVLTGNDEESAKIGSGVGGRVIVDCSLSGGGDGSNG